MIKTGLDLWMNAPELRTARLGLVSHPAATLPNLTGAGDALRGAGSTLTALFGPEHGFSGAAADGAKVDDATDSRTGLPVFSLYGANIEPTEAMLAHLDALVFDMQDVGVRFYTYLSALFHVLRGAGKAGKPVFVLDRPNPITGTILEGGEVEAGFESFVGIVNIPIRHGMTLGELAGYMNTEYALGADLQVVKMQGWRREMWFDETGLPWVPTSPAMPHLSTATLYPGLCLLEGCNLSLGRGTALPFEICGAPWLDGYALAEEMNALNLSGARFRPTLFTPSASNHAGVECSGVQVHVTDRNALRPVEMALHLLAVTRRMSGEAWAWNPHFERLAGSSGVRSSLEAGEPVSEMTALWAESISRFNHQREKYLLY
jgi:uncharacterized protein YbbC (DUF1343 family)